MANSRSGYKRPYSYQPPAGVTIPVRTEEAWSMLTACARDYRCTVGQWAESNLRYALSGTPYIGEPRRPACVTPVSKPRQFEISETLHDAIMAKVGESQAFIWIGRTLLFLAEIELRRQHGAIREPDRNWV